LSLDFTLAGHAAWNPKAAALDDLAVGYLPELFFLIIEPEQSIPRIVGLAAIRAGKKAAQMSAVRRSPQIQRK
jgi:hypothetical protein